MDNRVAMKQAKKAATLKPGKPNCPEKKKASKVKRNKHFSSNNNHTKLSPRSHPRHLVRKRTAQKDAIKDITSDNQDNSYTGGHRLVEHLTSIFTYFCIYI